MAVVCAGYLLLAILALGANPMDGETVAPMDLLLSQPGWESADVQAPVAHPERSDVLDFFIPVWMEVKRNLRAGDSALWVDTLSGGMPGLLLISNGILTPSFLAFAMIEDDALGFYMAGLIKLVLAGLGTFLLLRLFLGTIPSLFGGAIYMLTGFNASWFFWPQVSTSAWIPWLLWCTAAWMLSYKPRWLIGIVVTTSLLILGGFPSVAAYGLYAFLLLLLIFMTRDPMINWIQGSLAAGLAIVLAFLVTSLPLLAQFEFLSLFDLSYRTGGTPLSWITHRHLFVDPYAAGIPRVELTLYSGKIALLFALVSLSVLEPLGHPLWRRLLLFGVVALLISVILAFGLAPHHWIRSLPVFGANPWNRVTVITGLALAILAALGLQMLLKQALRVHGPRPLTYGLMAAISALVMVQIGDQMRLFRAMNATVPGEWFLPSTPSLKYVRQRLDPMEWVLADRSFLMSGTLVAYGLPEWFAHTFKTPAEKTALGALVRSPFRSPTSASFPREDIQFDHPLMNAFGIRYALISNDRHHAFFRQEREADQKPAPSLPTNTLRQTFSLTEIRRLSGISVLVATYHAAHAPSDLTLTLFDTHGALVTTNTVSKHRIRDNREVLFAFPEPLELAPGDYSFSLRLEDPEAPGRLTAWTTKPTAIDAPRLILNGQPSDLAMRFALLEPARPGHDWIVRHLERRITVLENPNAPGGAYYIRDPEQQPNATSGAQTSTARASPTVFTARYQGNEPGLIVFPMRHYPGWEARVDDQPVAIQALWELFPAIPVPGAATVELRYRPMYTLPGLLLTLAGLLGLFLFRIRRILPSVPPPATRP